MGFKKLPPEFVVGGLGLLYEWTAREAAAHSRTAFYGVVTEPTMTMLDAAKKTNGHAEPTRAWEARIEQRVAEFAASGEQRVLALRDAIGEFVDTELAPRDEEIATLKKRVADLEHKLERKTAVDQQVDEIAARLEERQSRRDRSADGDFIQTMTMVIAQERQSARSEFKAAVEEAQRAFERKLAPLEQRIIQHTDQRIIQHIEQCSGRTRALSDVIATERADRQKGVKTAVEEAKHSVEVKLEALEQRLKAVPGKLPVAKIWRSESVTYEGEFVCHDGALYQARKDTAQVPGGVDWILVAHAGRDGCDGRTPNVCGEYDARKTYVQLDVVAFDGASFIAHKDGPGICPGPDWQLLSRQGKSGRRGESITGPRGEKGEKGDPGPVIVNWHLDPARYRAIPFMSDGTPGPELNLYPLFEAYHNETH